MLNRQLWGRFEHWRAIIVCERAVRLLQRAVRAFLAARALQKRRKAIILRMLKKQLVLRFEHWRGLAQRARAGRVIFNALRRGQFRRIQRQRQGIGGGAEQTGIKSYSLLL